MGTLRRLLAAAGFDIEVRLIEVGGGPGDRLRRTETGDRVARNREAILAAIAAHGGRNVRVFGSVARGEAGGGSDLDLLVELPARTGILTLGRIARDVERIVGVEIDVVPEPALRPEVRARVLAEAVPL